MKYYSLKNSNISLAFNQALKKGLSADKGLYFPKKIPKLSEAFFQKINKMTDSDIAFETIKLYVGKSIKKSSLLEIVRDTLNFNFPLVKLSKNIYTLELFHGPTLAFKDVGARFMSRCLSYSLKKDEKITVLVATSGDTGGAVANGFMDIDNIDVVVLYPKNKVSDLQERQFTTLGKNIKAISVDGTFDDCQRFVKDAFMDIEINNYLNLTSANSINIARWIPQMFYYFISYKKLSELNKKLVFSVPSGNFGNLCSGILAKKMGLPIDHFIASTNINDVVPKYINTGVYTPRASQETISNAMDVGNPSNFVRIEEIFNNNYKEIVKNISGYKFSDTETRDAISCLYNSFGYVSEPHAAIAYLGLKKFLKQKSSDFLGVFLGTAHPIKFKDVVEKETKSTIKFPNQLEGIFSKSKEVVEIKKFQEFKSLLMS
ncbi:MAG: threonine synthase [Flavobacteriaceae bacterium]|nr:threonine synthase [Flavobacteriaceae bacterium]